jgi:hypothetical protein
MPEERRVMPSIFSELCDLCNQFERAIQALEDGPRKDHLGSLAQRLDELIDRTIGIAAMTKDPD